jgi:methyl-accepting chemotaxis protein
MNYQSELLEKYRREILYRFNVTFVVVFFLGFIIYSIVYFQNEKNDDWNSVSYTVKEAVTLHFDSLITLMLTGNMEHKDILRKKMLSRPNVVDIRLIRNSTIFKLTTADQQPKDELEKKGIKK